MTIGIDLGKPTATTVSGTEHKSSVTGSPKPYSPAVGDVVEFKYGRITWKGIVFYSEEFKDLCIASTCGTGRPNNVSKIKKIGHTDKLTKARDYSEADPIAKAYFATPQFKIGDRVKIARAKGGSVSWLSSMDEELGCLYTLNYVTETGVTVDGSKWFFPVECLEPVK